jgi:hypothetical protein
MEALAEDLRTETVPRTIVERLRALYAALDDVQTYDYLAVMFLRAGGLPVLIPLLRGTTATSGATSDPETPLQVMAELAGLTLLKPLLSTALMAELPSPTATVPPLIDVFRDAPLDMGRLLAAQVLLQLAKGEPAHRRAMAEGGVVGLVGKLYYSLPDGPGISAQMEPALELACLLMCAETAALWDLRKAILSPDSEHSFAALLILQVSCSDPPLLSQKSFMSK